MTTAGPQAPGRPHPPLLPDGRRQPHLPRPPRLGWPVFARLARDGDLDQITALIVTASEQERRAVAGQVAAGLRAGEPALVPITGAAGSPGTGHPSAGPAPVAGRASAGPAPVTGHPSAGSVAVAGRAPAGPAPGYMLAVIGCAPTARWAFDLLSRPSMRTGDASWVERFRRIVRARQSPWLGDLGARLARRLPAEPAPVDWLLAATVIQEAGDEPPVTESFVRGWVQQILRPVPASPRNEPPLPRLRDDPFLDRLWPALFDIDGMGRALSGGRWDPGTGEWDPAPWIPHALAALATDGRLDRSALLPATLDRLARGGFTRPFVLLHQALAPTAEETLRHRHAYARMITHASATIAATAQRALRQSPVDLDTLLDVSATALLRTEKSVVRAQLSWLNRAASTHPGRRGEILTVAAAAFTHPAADVQQSAVDLIRRHATALRPRQRESVADAAHSLVGDLQYQVTELLGASPRLAPTLPPVSPPPHPPSPLPAPAPPPPHPPSPLPAPSPSPSPPPAGWHGGRPGPALPDDSDELRIGGARDGAGEMPPPIASVAELAEEVASLLVAETAVGWERVLAGFLALYRAGAGLEMDAVLRPLTERYPYSFEEVIWVAQRPMVFLGVAIRRLSTPADPGPAWKRMTEALRVFEETGERGGPDSALARTPDGMLAARVAELAARFTDEPSDVRASSSLLATPTHRNGSLDAGTLWERLVHGEAAGRQPWPIDLEQALLRVPRKAEPAVIAAAKQLTSPAGRLFARWIGAGGLPDPVGSRVEQRDGGFHPERLDPAAPVARVVAELRPADPPAADLPVDGHREPAEVRSARQLLTVERDPRPFRVGWETAGDPVGFSMVLPHHREVVAAWVLPEIAHLVSAGRSGAGRHLPVLADGSGPAGVATALALVYGMAARHEADRVAAVDLFLALAAEGQAFAGAMGTELGRLGGADGLIKVSRVVPALADAHRAGASAQVWETLAAALPHLLPVAPRGLPELIALATEVALAVFHRDGIPVGRSLAGTRDATSEHSAITAPSEISGLAAIAGRAGTSRLVKEARRLRAVLAVPVTAG